MPLASAARMKKSAKEPLVVKGEGIFSGAPKGRRPSIDRSDEEKKREIPVRRRSSSVGRGLTKEEVKEKKEEHTHRTGDPSCDGCGKVHHGLLQLQYTQSLEQQIALLELENNYLKDHNQPAQPAAALHQILRPPPSSHFPPSTGHSSLPQPSHHYHSALPTRPLWTEMIPEVRESPPSSGEREPRREKSGGFGDSGRGEERRGMRSSDTELLHRLEDYSQKLLGLERKLKEKMRESRSKEESIKSLESRLREIEGNLNTKTDADAQQKRALMEEILDLQRRLDELTPILAQKEAIIARLENEKDELTMKMRGIQSENSHLQIRVTDRGREESLRVEAEEERRRERQRVEMVVREKEGEIEAARSRDRMHIEEMTRLKREVREEEMKRNQQKSMIDKLTEENGKLVKECSKLAAEVSRLEIRAEHAERDNQLRHIEKEASRELAELKERENSLRIELAQVQESLHAERECSTLLQNQARFLKEGSSREGEIRDARSRMERELEALHGLSKSLSSENTTLRQEKLAQEETIDSLKMKILEKDRLVHERAERLRESERKYEDAMARVEEETSAQRQRTIELEELGQKLKDLSESLPRSTHNSATRSTVSHKEVLSSRSQELHRSMELSHRSAHSRVSPCSVPMPQPYPRSRASIDEVIEMTRSALGTIHH